MTFAAQPGWRFGRATLNMDDEAASFNEDAITIQDEEPIIGWIMDGDNAVPVTFDGYGYPSRHELNFSEKYPYEVEFVLPPGREAPPKREILQTLESRAWHIALGIRAPHVTGDKAHLLARLSLNNADSMTDAIAWVKKTMVKPEAWVADYLTSAART